jgi:hypothetical protein
MRASLGDCWRVRMRRERVLQIGQEVGGFAERDSVGLVADGSGLEREIGQDVGGHRRVAGGVRGAQAGELAGG